MIHKDGSIVIEQIFDKPINQVWKAISKPKHMTKWFFEQMEDFIPLKGFKTSFVVKVDNHVYTHLWMLIEVVPQKKIVYSWKYKEFKGNATVTFELSEMKDKTKLTLTNLGLATFPRDIPEFSFESCNEGWAYFINNRLKNYLSK